MLKDNESTATTLHSERKLNERMYVRMERQQHTAIYTNLRILSTAAAETPN